MPKNQFQRPTPVTQKHQVPRHGKPLPPQSKAAAKPLTKVSEASLPPLEALLAKTNRP